MNEEFQLKRRQLLSMLAGGVGIGLVPGLAWSGDSSSTTTTAFALAKTSITNRKVVIIGGGMAGAAVAKYLRLWGGSGLPVTIVEKRASYTSNIMSNLVLNGSRTLASLDYTYAQLMSRYGVAVIRGEVVGIDNAARKVTLASGATLPYDRLVIAPGVEFDDAYGLTKSDYETTTPHAWQAGAQTQLLRNQLAAMPSNGIFVMTIPAKPYRCPPGPYERACLVADYLKKNKGTGSRVIVLDQNAPLAGDTKYSAIQAERHTFETAFTSIHAGIVDYRSGVSGITINRDSKAVVFTDGAGTQSIAANVVNPIPPHRAAGSNIGGLLQRAGLANSGNGRWAGVNVLSYESTALNAAGIHVLGDAADTGMPKAGHIANQEAKICADAIVRLFQNQALDGDVVANSACYSPITASTASWLTAVYQYVPPVAPATLGSMKIAGLGGATSGGAPIESATISGDNFEEMNIWFRTLMGDTFA